MKPTSVLAATIAFLPWVVDSSFAQQRLKDPAQLEVEANLEEAKRVERQLRATLAEIERRRASLEGRRAEVARDAPSAEEAAQQARIVNGVLTVGFPTTGALIYGSSAAGAISHCSGTLVGCRTFLTANHCVEDDRNASRYHVYLQHAGIFPVENISPEHPEYRFPHADLAVLRLGDAVEGITPTRINEETISIGTGGTIVGFGRSGGLEQDYGIKRTGRVTTAKCGRSETSLLCWNFSAPVSSPGEDSNTCNADSGGPLFIGDGDAVRIAGVTSGGTKSSCLAGDSSYDVDVRQFARWIRERAGDDLGAERCGDLPAIGSGAVQYFGDAGDLAGAASIRYKLTLPVGLAVLRVAANGEDTSSTNLNLFVEPASSSRGARCEEKGSGQYSFCEFQAPAAGDWFIEVAQKGAGEGVYQVVATLIGRP